MLHSKSLCSDLDSCVVLHVLIDCRRSYIRAWLASPPRWGLNFSAIGKYPVGHKSHVHIPRGKEVGGLRRYLRDVDFRISAVEFPKEGRNVRTFDVSLTKLGWVGLWVGLYLRN